ncbi:hypothetical protein PR202_gb28578 [Eleusine coracana subsp. coracana]|uniref:Uncharacterized protein n=1 Tax=Eleusine coracana subsp. coracana TaxID=191504 RepID=A0AAV5FXK7_ELECO|nr:hypothetical protein PR202_gb28578 [Eleusine coracana subsp. coracana]
MARLRRRCGLLPPPLPATGAVPPALLVALPRLLRAAVLWSWPYILCWPQPRRGPRPTATACCCLLPLNAVWEGEMRGPRSTRGKGPCLRPAPIEPRRTPARLRRYERGSEEAAV